VRNPVAVDAYNIDATEVTVTQYAAFLTAKGSNTSGQPAYCSWNTSYQPTAEWPRSIEYGDMPVAWIDWCDAYAYCQWAGRRLCGKIGGGPNLTNDYDNRALSQWMHACSGPNNTLFPYGNQHDSTRCNGPEAQVNAALAVGAKSTCVGGYAGLYDMSGNVWEWEDSCAASSGPDDICRWRGSSYVGNTDGPSGVFLQCDANNNNPRSITDSSIGFRCCK
jgi:formylglycine-generating enzyme required for sulfatase activity